MDNQLYEIEKGYYRNVLERSRIGKGYHTSIDLIIVDESTILKFDNIFSIAKNDHVSINILSVFGYFKGNSSTAQTRADNIREKINEISSISVDQPEYVFGISVEDNPNIDYYGKISYSLYVKPPTDLPTNTSNCWQITLGGNATLGESISPRRLLALEMGLGTFVQYSDEDCDNTHIYEREFIYGTIGVVYGLRQNTISPNTTFMTLIQKFVSKLGVNTSLVSNAIEIDDVKLDGGFVTSRKHKLEDFGNALLINCTVALNLSAGFTAASTCSLIVIVIPVHDHDGIIRAELVGTIIAGNKAGVTFDTEITAEMSLSLTAGFIHLLQMKP